MRWLAEWLGLVEGRVAREEERFRAQYGELMNKEQLLEELGDTGRTAVFDILDDEGDDHLKFEEFMFIKYLGINNSLTAKLTIIFKMFDTDRVGVLDR